LRPSNDNKDLVKLLKNFVSTNSQTKNAVQTDVHSGSLFANGGIKNHVLNGFIAIGDAACQINPLGGEGIRHALYSGRFASEVIDSALESGNVGTKSLEPYNKMWSNYVKNKWKISLLLSKFGYNSTIVDDTAADKLVKSLSLFSAEEVFDLLFNYKFSLVKNKTAALLKEVSKNVLRKIF
jgi:flavin-dependent dehydrogenase